MNPFTDEEAIGYLIKEMTGEDPEDLFGADWSNIVQEINS
jgi:hypothetical protein